MKDKNFWAQYDNLATSVRAIPTQPGQFTDARPVPTPAHWLLFAAMRAAPWGNEDDVDEIFGQRPDFVQ